MTEKLVLPPNIKLISFFERVLNWMFGCQHNWGHPFRSREIVYPNPYDAHQTCNRCGGARFYQFYGGKTGKGPLFKILIDSGITKAKDTV